MPRCVNDGIAIDGVDGRHEALLQFLFGRDADVTQHGAGELREEALDEVEQEPCFGVKTRVTSGLGDVGRAIVENELDGGRRRIGGIELLQEGDELAGTVSFLDAGADLAGEEVDAGQEAQRSVPDIFMIAPHARMARRRGPQVWRRRSDRLQAGLLVIGNDRDRRGLALFPDRLNKATSR